MSIQDTIDKLRMGVAAISDHVMVGVLDKDNASFKYKIDLTSDFLKCTVDYFGESDMSVGEKYERDILGGDKKYNIRIERIK